MLRSLCTSTYSNKRRSYLRKGQKCPFIQIVYDTGENDDDYPLESNYFEQSDISRDNDSDQRSSRNFVRTSYETIKVRRMTIKNPTLDIKRIQEQFEGLDDFKFLLAFEDFKEFSHYFPSMNISRLLRIRYLESKKKIYKGKSQFSHLNQKPEMLKTLNSSQINLLTRE